VDYKQRSNATQRPYSLTDDIIVIEHGALSLISHLAFLLACTGRGEVNLAGERIPRQRLSIIYFLTSPCPPNALCLKLRNASSLLAVRLKRRECLSDYKWKSNGTDSMHSSPLPSRPNAGAEEDDTFPIALLRGLPTRSVPHIFRRGFRR